MEPLLPGGGSRRRPARRAAAAVALLLGAAAVLAAVQLLDQPARFEVRSLPIGLSCGLSRPPLPCLRPT